MPTGANLPGLGSYNQTVVLDTVRHSAEGISRIELAERTGLSATTVTNVVRRLLAAGLVSEGGTVVQGVGKPRTLLGLEARSRCAVGVHLDPSRITVVLLDLAGGIMAHSAITTPVPARAPETVSRIAGIVQQLLEREGVAAEQVLGLGVAAPGPIDVESGSLVNPPLLAGWENVPLRHSLAEATSLPVLLEKDVMAAAIAQLWVSDATVSRNVLFFYYGTGVGAGITLDGVLLRGATGNVGEVGNLVIGSEGGRRWTLGDAIMPRLLVEAAIERGVLRFDGAPSTTDVVRLFGELAAAAERGDAGALALVDELAVDIARGLVSLIGILDVDRVVFGGPFFRPVAGLLLDRVPRLVMESSELESEHRPVFVESELGEDVAAIGAASIVLDDVFSPRPEGLLIRA